MSLTSLSVELKKLKGVFRLLTTTARTPGGLSLPRGNTSHGLGVTNRDDVN